MVQRTTTAEVMCMDLSPKKPVKAYGSDGGSYYDWSPADLPMLGAASIGAAKLHLSAGGLALPSYSDSAKVAYVLQGAGACGLVLPEAAKEKVIPVKEGDALALPFGAVTWWHNTEGSTAELVVLFLGDTSKGHTPGRFTNFQLTGASGIFTGFSTEFVARAWDLDQNAAAKIVSTQPGSGVVKIAAGHRMPEPRAEDREGVVLNCLEAPLDVDIPGGGCVVVLNTANLPLVKEVGLGADLVRIGGRSMCSPGFSCDSAYQVTYIVRGGGRVQAVGIDGTRVLETRAEAGCLFIVPRFFVVSKIADDTGMEWFSIITTPNPIFSHLAGRTSVWKAISPAVLESAFNTSPEMEKLFRSKRLDSEIFFAPS
ncbi:11S globulin seed storage protein 2-like [Triticum dicoccoides]|uniref:11S globulin seed storage protein 2-like n=1 Tax=Triticum dicoccoides TaxID=85692 RepID=UPI00188E4438|nr:11S globulin seed storage protein 2-like [Triticum dicoccoides]